MSDGIFWVFFDLPKGNGEMRLQVDASSEEVAIECAKAKAKKMSSEWVYTKTQGCR